MSRAKFYAVKGDARGGVVGTETDGAGSDSDYLIGARVADDGSEAGGRMYLVTLG